MTNYAWAVWLAVPVAATLLAAVWTWWRGRPPKTPRTRAAIVEHAAYLEALAQASERGPSSPG